MVFFTEGSRIGMLNLIGKPPICKSCSFYSVFILHDDISAVLQWLMVNLIGAVAIEDKQDKQQYDVDFAFWKIFFKIQIESIVS